MVKRKYAFGHISNLEKNLNSKYKFIEPLISFGSIDNKNKNNLFSD